MVSAEQIKHRAMMMAIATGDMPNVELIWAVQRREGSLACFGRGDGCKNRSCKWRLQCIALDFYGDTKLPIAERIEPIVVRTRKIRNHRGGKTHETPLVERVENASQAGQSDSISKILGST